VLQSAPMTKRPRHAWMLLALFPLGFGAWVPLVAGLRARRPLWVALGILYCAVLIAGFIVSSTTPDDEDGSFAGMLIVIPWAAAAATTLAIYPSYRRRRALLEEVEQREQTTERRQLEIQQREREREQARELVRKDPVAALERGVGRPDLPGAHHGDLVDVNHAPRKVLQTLPGVDADLARRIVATREGVGQFSSVADMAFVLDLDPDTSARLERVAIAIDA
jgi:4-amino-4-deoxy-L-arabinose transferase-like glycosyltransferase